MNNLTFSPTSAPSGSSKYEKSHEYYNADLVRVTAQGCWSHILESLGIPSAYLSNKHGACPICRSGKDRFRFDDKGRGCYFCNKCGAGDGFKLLQLYYGWNFPFTLKTVAKALGQQPHQILPLLKYPNFYIKKFIHFEQLSNEEVYKRRKRLTCIWQKAKTIVNDDPVDCYLKARSIKLDAFPMVLRFHPSLPYYNDDKILIGNFPAMLAMVQDENNRGITIHRTYLGSACKADVPQPKKLMPSFIRNALRGAAIKLSEPDEDKLAIAEGIETALAFQLATKIPVWASINAWGMENIILPPSVTDITIAVDNDKSGRGQKAAFILSQRLLSEGRRVKRVIPPTVGTDFADMLKEER